MDQHVMVQKKTKLYALNGRGESVMMILKRKNKEYPLRLKLKSMTEKLFMKC